MERIVRLLLITILATAATATYDYDPQHVQEIRGTLHRLPAIQSHLHIPDEPLKWELTDKTVISFRVNPLRSSGTDCSGRPVLTLHDQQRYCLTDIILRKCITESGRNKLTLALGFREITPFSYLSAVVCFDLLRKPSNQAATLEGVVQAEPITRQQLATLRSSKTFEGSTSWIQGIFQEEIRIANFQIQKPPRLSNLFLKGYPIVVDTEIMNGILEIPSLELGETSRRPIESGETQYGADLDTTLRL